MMSPLPVPGLSLVSYLVIALFGLLFGSFANVLIWRVPREESIAFPPSHCPACNTPIMWFDNIPVLSWMLLRGRCRHCAGPISWRYPFVEIASAVLWVAAYARWGWSAELPLAIVFFYLLLVLAAIDIDTKRLPTPLVAVIAVAGTTGAALSQVTGTRFGPLTGIAATGWFGSPLAAAVMGFLLGGGTSVAIAALYGVLRKVDGLGFGDVRLLGAMGIVLGPYVLLAYAMANILGLLGAVPLLIKAARSRRLSRAVEPIQVSPEVADFWDRRLDGTVSGVSGAGDPLDDGDGQSWSDELDARDVTPDEPGAEPMSISFGPFLAAAGIATALWGPTIWTAYLRTIGLA